MASWTIDPTTVNGEPITNNNNGEFIFPKNTGTTDITFTITYRSDSGKVATATYILKSGEDCLPCTFSIGVTKQLDCNGGNVTFKKIVNP